MKKFCYLICVLVLCCFVSCGYYVPEKDYSERLSKVEYKSFDSLNNPFIFRFDANLNFNSRAITRTLGSYYFIYDWETDTVFDYVYSPKDDTSGDLLIQYKNENGNLEYIGSLGFGYFGKENKSIFSMQNNKNTVEETVLNSKEIFKDEVYVNFGNINYQQGKDYKIIFCEGFKKNLLLYFDVNSKSITKTKKLSVKDVYSVDVFVDSNGVCWYLERFENEENRKKFERICSYDFATDTEIKDYLVFDCIGDSNTYDNYKGWIYEDFYDFEYIDSDFIVCNKSRRKRIDDSWKYLDSLVVIDKKDKTQREFVLENFDDCLVDFVKVQNDYYIALRTLDGYFEIQKINLETLEKESLVKRNSLFYRKIEVRDNRIYFINKTDWNTQKAEIFYYDVLENQFFECEKIIPEEYFEKLEGNNK